jgi:hypothetical protein
MCLFLLAVVAPLSADLEPPTTSLDVDLSSTNNNFVDECCDGGACGDGPGAPCRIPVASAYDHHEGDISERIVRTYNIFVESQPGQSPTQVTAGTGSLSEDSFQALLEPNAFRGELVIRYDVQDQAENDAEQISFGIVMRDTIAPEYLLSTVTEAYYGDVEPFLDIQLSSFRDSFDGAHISVDLSSASGVHLETLSNPFAGEDSYSSSFVIPGYHGYNCVESTITAVASDYADIFGKHNLDNKLTIHPRGFICSTNSWTLRHHQSILPTFRLGTWNAMGKITISAILLVSSSQTSHVTARIRVRASSSLRWTAAALRLMIASIIVQPFSRRSLESPAVMLAKYT